MFSAYLIAMVCGFKIYLFSVYLITKVCGYKVRMFSAYLIATVCGYKVKYAGFRPQPRSQAFPSLGTRLPREQLPYHPQKLLDIRLKLFHTTYIISITDLLIPFSTMVVTHHIYISLQYICIRQTDHALPSRHAQRIKTWRHDDTSDRLTITCSQGWSASKVHGSCQRWMSTQITKHVTNTQ
jgi:hypothetical protein